MNLQYIFDAVVKHAGKQQAIAINSEDINDFCMYRAPDGKKCFVGALIKDEFYSPDLENNPVKELPVIHAVEKSLGYRLSSDELSMLKDLQAVHDNASVPKWQSIFEELAVKYHIQFKGDLYNG